MAISLKPTHLKRYKDIAWLLVKYGRGDLAFQADLQEDLTEEQRASAAGWPGAEELASDLGKTLLHLNQAKAEEIKRERALFSGPISTLNLEPRTPGSSSARAGVGVIPKSWLAPTRRIQ